MSIKLCEIIISPPEDPFMGEPVSFLVAVPLENLAAVVPLINKTGLRVTAIRQFDALTPEEFVDKQKLNHILGALMSKPKFEEATHNPEKEE